VRDGEEDRPEGKKINIEFWLIESREGRNAKTLF
jgi:hypothetical protein